MGLSQKQLNRFFEIINASKLPSELLELLSVNSNGLHLAVQDGTTDAKKIKIPLLRGIKGDYNAATNTPTLIDGTGIEGDTYITTVAGSNDYGSGVVTTVVNSVLFYISGKWTLFNEVSISLKVETFVATHNQTVFVVSSGAIIDDGLWTVQVGSALFNSTTGITSFTNGGMAIVFGTGTITFNTPLQGGAQVIIKYN